MKKTFLLIIAMVFLSCTIFGQEKKSDYVKYRESLEKAREDSLSKLQVQTEEYDDLYYIPGESKAVVKDTVVKKIVVVNNYYETDDYYYSNRINHFYYPTYYYNWYNPYYSWYDSYYNGWYNP